MFLFIFAMLAFVGKWIITMILGTEHTSTIYVAMLGLAKIGRINTTGVFKAGNLKAVFQKP